LILLSTPLTMWVQQAYYVGMSTKQVTATIDRIDYQRRSVWVNEGGQVVRYGFQEARRTFGFDI
jgi:hypothetical protein